MSSGQQTHIPHGEDGAQALNVNVSKCVCVCVRLQEEEEEEEERKREGGREGRTRVRLPLGETTAASE